MENVIEIFKAYNGTGYYCILFIASLMYLWFAEEDKNIRAILVIAPTILQVLFFIPYFYMLYNVLDNGTYYRILWLLPMTIVIAYSACKVIGNNTRMGLAIVSVILVISGQCVYTSVNMSRAKNYYHLPEEAIELCEIIMPEEGRERVWAAFPPDMIHFVRQYSTRIQLAYGRESYVDSWEWMEIKNELGELYKRVVIPADELSRLAEEYYCNYVIVERERVIDGSLEDYGMYVCGATDNYIVYRTATPFWDDINTDSDIEEAEDTE